MRASQGLASKSEELSEGGKAKQTAALSEQLGSHAIIRGPMRERPRVARPQVCRFLMS